MSKIRDEFRGVLLLHTPAGVVWLRAGDTVPDGVSVDPSLVAGGDTVAPKRGGSRVRKS